MGEPTPGRDSGPPGFLQLAGHPVRWRLLRELARSDRQVRELTSLTGHPQPLVSYHLGRLRAAQLVSARRSSADGRDAYYTADLARCGELLAAAGRALHPALAPGQPRHIHWSIPDPAAAGDTDEASYPAFQATAAELDARIGFLLAAIAATPARSAHQEA